MTDPIPETGEMAALRAAIERLEARLDRLEARPPAPAPLAELQGRVRQAWSVLRGAPPEPSRPPAEPPAAAEAAPRSGRGPILLAIGVGLLALVLAVELVEAVFDGLRRVLRWLF